MMTLVTNNNNQCTPTTYQDGHTPTEGFFLEDNEPDKKKAQETLSVSWATSEFSCFFLLSSTNSDFLVLLTNYDTTTTATIQLNDGQVEMHPASQALRYFFLLPFFFAILTFIYN